MSVNGNEGMLVLRVNVLKNSPQYHAVLDKMREGEELYDDYSLTFETESGECELLI